MKNLSASRQGSVIAIAMIFGAIALIGIISLSRSLMQQYKTTARYGVGQVAFHLAESGIELGMHALTVDQLGDSDWPSSATGIWERQLPTQKIGAYDADTTIRIVSEPDNIYRITSLASVEVMGRPVQRAVEVVVRQERTQEQVDANTGSGLFDNAMASRNGIKLNHNNPGMKVASYDSNLNFGVPEEGVNMGRLAGIATLSSSNGAIEINNANVYGGIYTAGGTISYSSGYNNPNQADQNATLLGPDSTASSGVDANYVSTNYDGEINDPDLPDSTGYTIISEDQNYWQNNSTVSIGSWNQPTWVKTERINTNQNATMYIVGDVVIEAERNLNLGGDIEIAEGATLTIMAGENIHINADYIDQQHPSQFQVIATGTADVVLNNFEVFSGVVNAPNSTVRLAGVGSSPKSQFRGAVVGKYIESTNGVEFYYDVQLGIGGSSDDGEANDGSEAVGEVELVSWAEVAPSGAL